MNLKPLACGVFFATAVAACTQPAFAFGVIQVISGPSNTTQLIGAGSFNLSGLTPDFTGPANSGILTSPPNFLAIGQPLININSYSGMAPSQQITGTGPNAFASSWTGDKFGVTGTDLFVPQGYPVQGGSFLAGTATISTSLNGLTSRDTIREGIYEFNWGSGDNADSLTICVGDGNVNDPRCALPPDPSEIPVPLPFFGAAAAFGYSRKLRKRIKDSNQPATSI